MTGSLSGRRPSRLGGEDARKDREWVQDMLEVARDVGRNRRRKAKRPYSCADSCPRCGSREADRRRFVRGFWRCCNTIVGAPTLRETA